MQTYCERGGLGLFDEPLNAISNLAFLLSAWAAWRLARRSRALSSGLRMLIVLCITVGVGSALWHTFATPWALVLDLVPIMLFQLCFLSLYGHHVARLRTPVIIALLVLFVGAGLSLRVYREWLNGILFYAPALVLAWIVGLHYYRSARRERFVLLASALLFSAALTGRTLDLILCWQFPLGTHFLWHALNGIVLYLAMRALIVFEADTSSAGPSAEGAAH